MIRKSDESITDEIREKYVVPCEEQISTYIKSYILNDYIAYNIATFYKGNALYEEDLDCIINSALEDLANMTIEDCDKNKIKQVLETKHNLKIINEIPIKIEELRP